jgi:hypothetical protein
MVESTIYTCLIFKRRLRAILAVESTTVICINLNEVIKKYYVGLFNEFIGPGTLKHPSRY